MPFKSKAQRRKFAQLLVEGEITPEVYEEWNRETGRAKLPERVKPKTPAEDENEAQSEDVSDPTEQSAGTVRKRRPEKAECADACCPSLTGNPGMA